MTTIEKSRFALNEDNEKTPAREGNAFSSICTDLFVGEQKFVLRALKMVGSTLLFVCSNQVECLDEIGVALCSLDNSQEVVATTLLGKQVSSDSQRLAEKLSKRFHRQFFVSYNVQVDRLSGPLLERALNEYIRNHESEFA